MSATANPLKAPAVASGDDLAAIETLGASRKRSRVVTRLKVLREPRRPE